MDFIEKYKIYLGGFLVLIIIAGTVMLLWGKNRETPAGKEKTQGEIRVDLEGAVKKPGVYSLKEGSIFEDLLKIAGGFEENADQAKIAQELNRAEELSDGQKIYIPFKGEVAGEKTETTSSAGSSQSSQMVGKININTATAEELDTLSGIGPAYAKRIIDYRTANGGFKSIDQIQEIKGIGPKTFEKIKDQITI